MLVLAHSAGGPLDRFIGTPLELRQFLRLAIGLSAALGRLHERGLVHKDIKPSNVLINSTTGQVWLTGFGIASRLLQSPAKKRGESCWSIRASMNRTKCSLVCKTSVLESSQRTSKRYLIPFTPPNRREWEWVWQSVAPLLRIMAGSYRPRGMTAREQRFNLRF